MQVARIVLALSLTPLLGCSPEYNWRELRPPGLGYQAMFPGKPDSASRDVVVSGQTLAMNLSAAQAGGHSFSVGVLQLKNNAPENRDQILAALRAQMLRNIAATESAATPFKVLLLDRQGMARPPLMGVRIEAQASNRPNRLYGAFVAREDRAYQVLVIGQNPDLEQVMTFIESFRLLE